MSMTPAQIEAAAHNEDLYHFEGGGDDLLHFSGNNGMEWDEADQSRYISFTLKNTSATASATVLFSPGLSYDSQGQIATGTFLSVEGIDVVGTEENADQLDKLHAYIYQKPVESLGVKITASSAQQASRKIKAFWEHPFEEAEETQSWHMTKFVDGGLQNPNIVIGPTPGLVFGQGVRIEYQLLAGSSATFDIWFGPSLDNTRALQAKTRRLRSGDNGRPKAAMMGKPQHRLG